ncbi:PAS domain S-box protein [Aestuariibacter halophilus]|uniref:histidine kinase n=1 Tax=Fluctibacter halophilus TaxID=226011 RepID=A0ABS8G3K0_9ALTE|nr:PAS domain-containing sensor histidine kinase [Aestuariibacter halophilus]MCC2615033.1 PAS domain S-box protein [Aestuariibacter halophilus]
MAFDPTDKTVMDDAFYREMVDSAHDGMLLMEDNVFIGCNQAACDLYGLSREELIGTHPGAVSPEFQPDGQRSEDKANQLIGAAVAGEPQKFLWEHIRAGHGPFTAEVTLNPARTVVVPGQGNKQRFVAVFRDVTVEQNADNALKESELRFRQLFDQAPVALTLTKGNDITAVNQAWLDMFGYQHDEARTLDDWVRLAYEDSREAIENKAAWINSVSEMENSGQSVAPRQRRIRCKDGSYRDVIISGAQVGDELMVSLYDITEQIEAQASLARLNQELEHRVETRTQELNAAVEHLKRTQNDLVQSEKLASLGALVAGVSHELNTPIGNAVTVSSSLKQRVGDFEANMQAGLTRSMLAQFIDHLKESAHLMELNLQRASELIGGFKQLAVDQCSYHRRQFALAEVLQEFSLSISPTLKKSQVSLTEEVEGDITLNSYPGPLTQILLNVVNNAVMHAFEHCNDRQVHIHAGQQSDQVTITVSDNGSGIPREHLPRLYDPFFTTKLGKGGSGLGLHIVYSLVKDVLGGTVSITNGKTSGTVVTLKLPVDAPAEGTSQALHSSDPTA